MRRALLLLGLACAMVLAGCTKPAPVSPNSAPTPGAPTPSDPTPGSGSPLPLPRAAAPTPYPVSPPVAIARPFARGPIVTIAHIDTGLNPYNAEFRDASPLAYVHPSQYIQGFPANATALRLSLNASTWQEAVKADDAVWKSVKRGELYWIPGTKIIGAISFADGGAACSLVDVPPASAVSDPNNPCVDHMILDDHGHGTMTATRMGGNTRSLCPECRIVSVEGLSGDAVEWVAKQGWIDVQTNSWGSEVPHAPGQDALATQIARAAAVMPVFFASGNGLAFSGLAPTPTLAEQTDPPGVIIVGAHDNGKATLWAGAPADIVADGYGGWRAQRDHMTNIAPDPIACCTSAASPYAAGGGAQLILDARRAVNDLGVGHRGANLVVGQTKLAKGPLSDGNLTLAEFRTLLFHSAEARPLPGKDDGLLHWTGDPTSGPSDFVTKNGPGANPFCQGCTTMPVAWKDIPAAGPVYTLVGYGAINERSSQLAAKILRGEAAVPARADEDAFFANEEALRGVLYP